MDLHKETSNELLISYYDETKIIINNNIFSSSLCITADHKIHEVDDKIFEINAISQILENIEQDPEIVVIGTGNQADTKLLQSIKEIQKKLSIGIELMNTPSAIRTINLLLSEDRKVFSLLKF